MNTACPFSDADLRFTGTPVEQAKCLLRRVRIVGNVDDTPAELPAALLNRIGNNVGVTRDQLQNYLTHKGISAADIGGALTGPVSSAPGGQSALYFVIHDTSDELPGTSFPNNINEASWPLNNLQNRSVSAAHVFINRVGQSRTGHDYKVAHKATKRERKLDGALKGLFLHHELIQPRLKGGYSFYAVAPQPGFTAATYDRLALCYIAASLRRGTWMIPAFHCVLDLGIPGGHDDPQNFDLFQWAGAIDRIASEITAPAGPVALFAAAVAAPPAASPPLETVRIVSDGKRDMPVRRIQGTTPLFFKAKFSVDADGAARAYHPNNVPEALDLMKHANKYSKQYIQGEPKNGKVGIGPHHGFYVSATALMKGEDHDAGSYVDAEFIPYIVLPAKFDKDVTKGDLCTIVNLNNLRFTSAIFADTNPNVGEASVRAAINLHVKDPSFPITDLAKHGGDEKDRYVYIVYPGSKLKPEKKSPYWPVERIEAAAGPLFAAWGGINMVKRIFG
jgi:hypothetical protein